MIGQHLQTLQSLAYRYFKDLFAALNQFQILSYTPEAESIYQSLSVKVKRIGRQDYRIAAIACANEFTIVTVNVNDFVSIGLADVEDWTR